MSTVSVGVIYKHRFEPAKKGSRKTCEMVKCQGA